MIYTNLNLIGDLCQLTHRQSKSRISKSRRKPQRNEGGQKVPSLLNPLTAAIYQTTGMFIDKLKEDDKVMNDLSRHFYRHHKEDYKAELHNLAVRKK